MGMRTLDRRTRHAGRRRRPHPLGPGVVLAVRDPSHQVDGGDGRAAELASTHIPTFAPFLAPRRPERPSSTTTWPSAPIRNTDVWPAIWCRKDDCPVGPWYVLMDEFCVSGETLIRNLQHGIRTAEVILAPPSPDRLPARHVRPREPDAADPVSGGTRSRRGVEGRSLGGRPHGLLVERPRRKPSSGRVPTSGLRQRGVLTPGSRRPGSPHRSSRHRDRRVAASLFTSY